MNSCNLTVFSCMQVNHHLKQIFKEMHSKIVRDVNPDPVIDALLSKSIINQDDYDVLRQTQGSRNRCREILSLLQRSSHPGAFIELRRALGMLWYPWIVCEIDGLFRNRIRSTQAKELQRSYSTDGKFHYKLSFM